MLREQRRRERSGEVVEVTEYDRPMTRADCAARVVSSASSSGVK